MSKVYLFNELTGEFEGNYYPQESPLEPGVFITPIHATDKLPPHLDLNQSLRFVNGNWVVLVAPADAPPTAVLPLTSLQEIRALEQKHDDDQRKFNRQSAIDVALTVACRSPAAAGKTRDEAHAIYYATNRGYRAMRDLETECARLRKFIV